MRFFRRLLNVFRPAHLDRQLREELEFHREMRLRRELERGRPAAQAQVETRRRLGNLSRVIEEMRDTRSVPWLASSLQDLHHGIVLLWRDAGISSVIILVLALGIGGTVAIFTLMKAAFLDPLPYRDASRLVTLTESVNGWVPSTSEFIEIRARSRLLEQPAFAEYRNMQITGAGEPVRVQAARVTASFFPLLGIAAAQGRTFVDEENEPGRAASVVLTDVFWRTQMAADPNVVGRAIRLDGTTAVVVGVLPPGFHFDYPTLGIPEAADIYVSYPLDVSIPFNPSSNGKGVAVRVLARLRNGVTLAEANAELRSIARVLTHDHPESFPNPQNDPNLFHFVIFPLREAIVGPQRGLLWLLLGGVATLLLIACANTAQLLLARSLRRSREIAIRSAIGASRLRLIRQFFLEGLVLALCGGAAGLLVAGWAARAIVRLLPVRSPLLSAAHLDGLAFAFTFGISVLSAVVFATLPAIKGSRWIPGASLSARITTGEGNRWRHLMIAIEAALSVFLLCGAALVAENLWMLTSTPMGFDPDHVVAMRLQLPARRQNLPDATAGYTFQEYVEKIEAIPGVDSAATVTGPPLRPARAGCGVELIGVRDSAGAPITACAWSHQISADYFRTLRIPLLAGRGFRQDDAGDKISIAIVNEEFARRFGLGRDVVGRQIADPGGPITIVGIVANVRTRALDTAPAPEIYLSSRQFSWANVHLVVRSSIAPGPLVKQIESAIQSRNSDQAVFGISTMAELISDSVTEPRFDAFLVGTFALLAVAMATAGLYSVISCLVSQRKGEIAIRLALGASRRAILRTVLGTTLRWLTAGLACGLALALGTRNTIRALSSVTAAASPWMYPAVIVFFFLVTLVAACMPLRRANRIDPATALRCDG